jgi:hypothetical protein
MTSGWAESVEKQLCGIDFSGRKEYGGSGIRVDTLQDDRHIGDPRAVRNQLVSAETATNQ